MMSEDEGVGESELRRRAFQDVPLHDEAAQRRALVRLRERIEQEAKGPSVEDPGTARRWGQRSLVAAAVIVGVLVLQSVLPSETGGPPRSAAAELQRLSRVAAAAPKPAPPSGAFFFSSSEMLRFEGRTDLTTSATYRLLMRETVEIWMAEDGSGRSLSHVLEVEFASPEDRKTWIEAGSPPLPEAGDRTVERYGTGELPLYDLSSLPTDPDELEPLIESGQVIAFGPGPENELLAIGTLLAQPQATPELRAALFEIAAGIPSVELLGDVQDPLGRPGVGVAVTTSTSRSELSFDPRTSTLLARLERPVQGGELDEPASWRAFTEMGIVENARQRPRSA